ncbi:MAG TPA: FeoA family protein [Noviherbaspirillum sp.]|uniref:FeoA family protein n=1 Tax=Noviherbaspirillum sp. TaxID=1926288 RepID=UPI002B47C334|nr:FeoA family protein [Noviherbaspirillum sp.]HJV84948.1 FeoA family protein [Noviherbaspirillum sp.]
MSNNVQPMHLEVVHLGQLKKGDHANVIGLMDKEGAEHAAMKRRLIELGFVPGESIRIVAESFPRRDPIAVRVGNTTFALRRHEASLVHVVRTNHHVN